MSDEVVNETTDPEVVDPAQDEPAEPAVDWKSKAREWERRAKQNKSAADELEQIKEAQKSESEKQADRLAKAEAAARMATADALRFKAAATHGIPSDYFDFLGGDSEDEINERASRLGDLVMRAASVEVLNDELEALKSGRSIPKALPVERLKPGATPSDNQNEDDVLYNAIFGGSRNG